MGWTALVWRRIGRGGELLEARGIVVVKAIFIKPEGRGFETGWGE
jgi:hypothetical protein